LTLEAARAAIVGEQLGGDRYPDLLAVSLSAHDYAGHDWGQESWERLDLLLRLDDQLGTFLRYLDDRVGRGRYAVVLTSDHGATALVEHSRRAGKRAERVSFDDIEARARQAAARRLGSGRWVVTVAASTVYMHKEFYQQPKAAREAALDEMVASLRSMPGIGYVTRVDRIAGDCDRRKGIAALACRSVVPELSGEIFFSADEHHLLTRYGTGTGHGSPNLPDREVPLVVSAPGWGAERVTDRAVSLLQVAPTLSALLGIDPPPAARAPALQPPPEPKQPPPKPEESPLDYSYLLP
jgi:arylsulfatase A-like enzyme